MTKDERSETTQAEDLFFALRKQREIERLAEGLLAPILEENESAEDVALAERRDTHR